jgi:small subunit ribosomal protein S6
VAVERQREYETVYILRPGVSPEDVTKTRERVEGVIENTGGHMLRFDDWGLRRLSYEVRDRTDASYHERGHYQYYRFLAPATTVAEIERNLRILDPVLKFLTVKLQEDLIPEERLARGVEEEVHDVLMGEEE